ncbi:ferritin [Clostridium grantii]|uniref:Ferritin n=1 Tax=Clostridium grantii DSM 8605 TaxID=1121316 RepID=A0A1M5XCQ0_9CLOT|nr:ferritin [Clostridium grantii]SHH97442.1 ferritin [Clostridium grantii DSM 8605]
MISEKLFNELNKQITYELFSAHFYLAMAAYAASEDLPGFENFFKVQAEEEKFHAMRFFDYINEMGGRVKLEALDTPENDFESLRDVFEKGLDHEKFVTSRIYLLTDIATEEREHATISFLKWFIDEQVEEEANFSLILSKLKRVKEDSNGIYMIDAELAQRVFTPPVIK